MGANETQNEAMFTIFLLSAGQNIVKNAMETRPDNLGMMLQVGILLILAGVWQAADVFRKAGARQRQTENRAG